MRHLITKILLLVCFALGSLQSKASHIFAADLLYRHLSGNTYVVMLTLYGDCSADGTLFAQLYTARPQVLVYNGVVLSSDTLRLTLSPGSGIEVSPVCPSRINETYCHGGSLPGIRQFIYTDTVTLSGPSANWRFVFNGRLGNSYRAGRSSNITNAAGGTVMQLQATLNNTSGPNNSPVYSTIPTPFYCLNILQDYNQGATDVNGDSLSFSLVTAINAETGGGVTYRFPYYAANPLSTNPGTYTYNSYNGQMRFNPDIVQNALVVNRVYEYKRGVLVGTSEREMTFIVLSSCSGTLPSPHLINVVGATVDADNTINICKGTPFVRFTIDINNPDRDIVNLTYNGLPAGATLNLIRDSTEHPYANFSWNTDTLAPGIYTFYLRIKNNHCPLISNQTVAYTIRVAEKPTIDVLQISPTECIHQAGVKINMTKGFKPRNVSFYKDGTLVKRITDTSDLVIDSLLAGNYIAVVSSDSLCTASTSFVVVDSGKIPIAGFTKSLCKNDDPMQLNIDPIVAGATVAWYNLDGSLRTDPPTVSTMNIGTYQWYFIQNFGACSSGPVFVTAIVNDLPVATILNIPTTVCYGDDIKLLATGGIKYDWYPTAIVRKDTSGNYATLINPTSLIVVATDANGCKDTATVTYNNIEQCCNFAFPNAFTPNNDGINDQFRMVTYGNMKYYSFSIYNRYGQRVFWSGDAKRGWDGTFGGEPCESGVYFYYLDAECLTGPQQQQKGDITLVR